MITARAYDPARDAGVYADLLADCLIHFDCPPVSQWDLAEMQRELAAPGGVACAIAWDGELSVGFATWVRMFPAGEGFAFYLKEIYVIAAARGRGAGRALFRHLVEVAAAQGVKRIEWSTSEAQATAVYDALAAPRQEKVYYRLPSEMFDGFARPKGSSE